MAAPGQAGSRSPYGPTPTIRDGLRPQVPALRHHRFSAGDNGTAVRVAKYTLNGALSKYVRDTQTAPDFDGTYTEADSTAGGPSAPSGNYCRFRNVRGASITLTAQGDYASDGHPRGPLNAIQIVPVDVLPVLSQPSCSAGQFQFFLKGATNASYVIQASTNLVQWSPIRTNPAPASISIPAVSSPHRFYRALFQ